MPEFSEVYHHRMRYFLTPQFDMYRNIRNDIDSLCFKRWGGGMSGDGPAISILDYGCGNGVGSVLLKKNGWKVTGVDSDEEAIAFAGDAWGHLCSFKAEDWAENLTPYANAFDVVVCLEVIEHVLNPEAMLHSLKRSLRSNGMIYISTLNHNSQYRKNRGHIGKFCLADFTALIHEFFPAALVVDYSLKDRLEEGSSLTPMVAAWRAP